MKKSFEDLEVYQISLNLFFRVHNATQQLPKFEMYELGSQIRRSSDSIVSNIVEGYGRRVYKNEFLRFLYFSHASTLETICHLNKLINLYPSQSYEFNQLRDQYRILGVKLHNFITFVFRHWKQPQIG